MSSKGQELAKKPETRVERSHGSEDRNPAHNLESSDKVIEDTALLVETKNFQSKARPSGASPNLMCKIHSLSNITHELDEATRDSQGIPQASTEESPQGTDPKRPQEDSNVTTPTNRSFEEIVESVIKDFPKIVLLEREDEPPSYIAEGETSTKNTEESSDTSDSSEFHHKMDEPVNVHKNPLFKRKSKMVSNGHPENSKPPQPIRNLNLTRNNQEELRHKQKANNTNPFTSCNSSVHQRTVNSNQGLQVNTQPNHPHANTQGRNTSGAHTTCPTSNHAVVEFHSTTKERETLDSSPVQSNKALIIPGVVIILTWDKIPQCPQMGATKTTSTGTLALTIVPKWGYPTSEVKPVLVSTPPMSSRTPIPREVPMHPTKDLPTQTTVRIITWDHMGMDQCRA
eukprot:Gb_32813 [translate_table: standard]